MIKFTCSNCNHKISAPERYAGKRVRCPKCKVPIRVPESPQKTDAQKQNLIKFRCPKCNQKIGVTPDYAGKRVRCAKCKNPLRVPQAPSQVERPRVRDETEVLRAGQEQFSADEGVWGDMEGLDELLLEEASAPAVERQAEQGPADFTAGESELPEYTGQLPESGALAERGVRGGPHKKKSSTVIIGAACVVGLILVVAVVWYFLADSGTTKSEMGVELNEVQKFAENYITLLEDADIDSAMELLSPELQGYVQVDEIEKFAKRIGKNRIVELDCEQTHFEEHAEGNQFFLWYNLRYKEGGQSVIVSVLEVDRELRIDGIAAQDPLGGTVSIGPSSFEELSGIVLAAAFEKFGSIFSKYFCGFMLVLLVLSLVQIVSMWVVFDKAGQSGWAAIVPFYNMWVLAEVGDKPGWLGLAACFSGAIPFVGFIIQLVLWMVISIGVAKAFGRGIAFGIGLFFVPFVFYPILAFASD